MSTSTPVRLPSQRTRDGRSPPRGFQRVPRVARWGIALVVVLIVLAAVLSRLLAPQPQAPLSTAPPPPAVVAHGTIAPVNQARVGTLAGGVLLEIATPIGTVVEGQRELARVRGPSGIEVLTAPFAGTVTGHLANSGDTLVPGAGVALVADLTRLQVVTNDVDEFLIGRVQKGMAVTLQVEALDRRELTGRVQTVALQPQTTAAGDLHYPVTIDLGGLMPELRPGMSVRVIFPN